MVQEIYIIDDDDSSIVIFRELFKNDKDYKFISVKTEQIDIALKNIPSLIVINEDAIDRDVVDLCRKIRKDEDNTITPVIVVSSKSNKEHRVRILQESIEYFIKKPVDEQYLYYTVKNLNRLLSSNRRISPLTGLPGNVQIHAELKKRIVKKDSVRPSGPLIPVWMAQTVIQILQNHSFSRSSFSFFTLGSNSDRFTCSCRSSRSPMS